jgi:hypothetical protein
MKINNKVNIKKNYNKFVFNLRIKYYLKNITLNLIINNLIVSIHFLENSLIISDKKLNNNKNKKNK